MIPLTEKQKHIEELITSVVDREISPIAGDIDEADVFPEKAYQALKQAGILKVALPEEYGGMAADAVSLCLVIKTLASASPATALIVFPTSAVIRTIDKAGNPAQRERFFSAMRDGSKMGGFVLTEPNHGSDAGSLTTMAVRDGDYYVVNGAKSFITLGSVADYYLCFVRTGPGKGTAGVSALIVEKDTPGLTFGLPERKMGLRGSVNAQLFFQNALVPAANLIGAEGQGWRVLTEAANTMRVWGAASLALGIAEGAFKAAMDHTGKRSQFGKRIAKFQAVQFMLADMKIKIEAVRSLVFRTAQLIDSGQGTPQDIETMVAICKCHASDVAMQVAIDAVQVLGRSGCQSGSIVERLMRDAKAVQIFDGSNQIQRLIVSRNLFRPLS
ncbi:MAG: acyl-CoA dehydrogenase family protein [Deltaproteobacteria bacterium]|nr:acyl-CoA dehydrogenase family protein [Deltaproteobacteria bacterium]